jgi:Ser/Thr protein kinase RdoA (MazF antagonist)
VDVRSERIFDDNSKYILSEACRRFGVSPDKLKRLGSFESVVYEYPKDDREFILKLTHSIHRTPEAIQGELEWTNYLAEGGVSAAPAILSEDGDLIEVIDVADSYFVAYAFEKAEGERPEASTWTDDLIRKWGGTTGRMHALTVKYQPSKLAFRRQHWHDDSYRDFENCIPPMQGAVLEKCNRHLARLKQLSTDPDGYGLIHSDLHHGNFLVNNGSMTVIDFDDCQYNWFAFDIAIPLYYALADSFVGYDNIEYARKFLGLFLSGYSKEYTIDSNWIKRLPDFLKLREMELYGILVVDPMESMNGWCLRMLKDRRRRIENDIPFIDLDFSEFA